MRLPGWLIASIFCAFSHHTLAEKLTVGRSATIMLAGKYELSANISTSSDVSSINARVLRILEPAKDLHDNVGKTVVYQLLDGKGGRMEMRSPIERISRITTSGGSEWRIYVALPVEYKGVKKYLKLGLADRSKMQHPVLLGVDFLRRDFIVDVDLRS